MDPSHPVQRREPQSRCPQRPKPKPNPRIQMAIHLPASSRKPGGTVNRREGPMARKSKFPVHPRMTAAGLCAIGVLAFLQPERREGA